MGYLQIGSWNIEHLSGQNRDDKKQSIYALTDHIEMAGIDLIALQEIYVTHEKDGQRRNEDLDGVCKLLEEHLHDAWDYEILPNRQANDKSQLCAIMWNTERLSKTGELALPVTHKDGSHTLWDRKPHAVKFTTRMKVWKKGGDGTWSQVEANKRFVVVPLHMKSNFGGATIARIIRGKEAKTLCEHLEAIRTQLDPSIILLGDTNVLKLDEPAIETFVTNGLIDLNNNDAATYWSSQYGEAPFDRVFVAEKRNEFKYTRQYVLRSSDLEKHDRFLSDHYMIKISIKLYVDDDDPR